MELFSYFFSSETLIDIHGHSWRLKLYPNGTKNDGNLSLFLDIPELPFVSFVLFCFVLFCCCCCFVLLLLLFSSFFLFSLPFCSSAEQILFLLLFLLSLSLSLSPLFHIPFSHRRSPHSLQHTHLQNTHYRVGKELFVLL